MEVSSKGEGKSVVPTTERAKPILVTVGNRQIISSGRWNDKVMADYVLTNGRSKWVSVGALAKVAYGHQDMTTKRKVRRYLHSLFLLLVVERDEFLVIEYEPKRGRAMAVKLFEQGSEMDRQALHLKLEKMRSRSELTAAQYGNALSCLQGKLVA